MEEEEWALQLESNFMKKFIRNLLSENFQFRNCVCGVVHDTLGQVKVKAAMKTKVEDTDGLWSL